MLYSITEVRNMRLSIGETAALFGISVRTLRYYDEIGLVKPLEISDSGYRYYGENEISKLQQVMFYRELELSLKEIAHIFDSPDYDSRQALEKHLEMLKLKRRHIDGLIGLVTERLGGTYMSDIKTTVKQIEETKAKYAKEARERWGNTPEYKQSEEKAASMNADDCNDMAKDMDRIFSALAEIKDSDPADEKALSLVKEWQKHITRFYYNCTDEILSSLGEMYTADERFKANIDRYGEGTAEFLSKAIKAYCSK